MIRCYSLLLFFVFLQNHAWAIDVEDLQTNEHFNIRAFLNPAQEFIVGGKLSLTVEVSTTRWFVGGTKISPLIMNNMVVGPIGAFATNFSRREKGVSWTVQQWTRNIYPLKEGLFTIPSMIVEIAIAGENGTVIKVREPTKTLHARAIIPAEMAGIKSWINAESLSIEQIFSEPLIKLKPGDAIEHTIITRAKGIPAMMLPSLQLIEFEGLARYSSTPKLTDSNNRGQLQSYRKDKSTYIVEKSGRYTIPQREIFWWNALEKRRESIILPGQEILTLGEIPKPLSITKPLSIQSKVNQSSRLSLAIGLFAATIFAGLLFLLLSNNQFQQIIKRGKHQRKVINLWSSGQQTDAMALYYKGIEGPDARSEVACKSSDAMEQILKETYGTGKPKEKMSVKVFASTVFSKKTYREIETSGNSPTELN